MPALPPVAELPHWIQGHPQSRKIVCAYNVCLGLESWVQREAGFRGKQKDEALIKCRILGYLFHHFPSYDIGPFVREVVTMGGRHEALLDLGELFYVYFIKLFMFNKGDTPEPSSHPSRQSVDDLVAKIKDEFEDAPQNHSTARRKVHGFQCVVTKAYDREIMYENKAVRQAVYGGAGVELTHCAHIIPESINSDMTSGLKKVGSLLLMNFANAWTVLDFFGHGELLQNLHDASIHRLDNVMTMAVDVHLDFDRLRIYFTATKVPNRYKLEAIDPMFLFRRPEYVTFSTPDAEKYPLPNPNYLAIHAACAKVAHLSGAAEHIEEVLRRMEDTVFLAEDGGSSEVLYTAILSSMPAVAV
ncbi:hypothetical protein EDD15DRAFT_2168442 [Pisolithus albus]|nr:hypothetical protein EDD15DRAFT_2168442 [Pisolithus albus]